MQKRLLAIWRISRIVCSCMEYCAQLKYTCFHIPRKSAIFHRRATCCEIARSTCWERSECLSWVTDVSRNFVSQITHNVNSHFEIWMALLETANFRPRIPFCYFFSNSIYKLSTIRLKMIFTISLHLPGFKFFTFPENHLFRNSNSKTNFINDPIAIYR